MKFKNLLKSKRALPHVLAVLSKVSFIFQAFKVAEEKLKVPALLEASDLVSMEEIDEMSVMTYLSMLYKRIKKNSSPGE